MELIFSSFCSIDSPVVLIFFFLLFCDLTEVPNITGEEFDVEFSTKKLAEVCVLLIEEKII